MNAELLGLGVMWYVVFLFSLTCHEASHALAAKLGGDLTAFHGGQVTLNPIPHMRREPFGTIVFPLLFSLNLLLAAFNLLPIPPLDGHTAVGLLLSEDGARRFAALGHNQSLAVIGLLVGWRIFGYLFHPMFLLALNVLYPGASYH